METYEIQVIDEKNLELVDYTYGFIKGLSEQQLNDILSSLTKDYIRIRKEENRTIVYSNLYLRTIFEVSDKARELGIQNHIWYARCIKKKNNNKEGDDDTYID